MAEEFVGDEGSAPEVQTRPNPGEADRAKPADDPASQRRGDLELAGLVIAATTLISALAFYFGWAITSWKFAYFGIDSSAIGFSAQDYILRSTDALFIPLGVAVVVALAALGLHAAVKRALAGRWRLRLLRGIARGGVAVGAVVLTIGLGGAIGSVPVSLGDLFMAASPGIGIALLAYCLHLDALGLAAQREARIGASASSSRRPACRAPRGALRPAMDVARVRVRLVCLFVGLSAFWTTAVFAAAEGRDRGKWLAENLHQRPAVTVFSPKALHLSSAGATESRLPGGGSAYRFRYTGLRLIFRADSRYFLVANDWQPSKGTAIVLTDDPSLRFEFRRGSGST